MNMRMMNMWTEHAHFGRQWTNRVRLQRRRCQWRYTSAVSEAVREWCQVIYSRSYRYDERNVRQSCHRRQLVRLESFQKERKLCVSCSTVITGDQYMWSKTTQIDTGTLSEGTLVSTTWTIHRFSRFAVYRVNSTSTSSSWQHPAAGDVRSVARTR